MPRVVIFGNSGSGKSTLAQRLVHATGSALLDLDTLAWNPTLPPMRRELRESTQQIAAFMDANPDWVIEGCYADLLAVLARRCTELLFLNPGTQACIENARARPWEPHKYPSHEAQDANLEMLIGWIADYETRRDEFSLQAHRALFDAFPGTKREFRSRDEVAAFRR
jgi:adenylate kinase family enzyme